MPTTVPLRLFEQHVAYSRLPDNRQTHSARGRYLLVGTALLLNVSSDAEVQVSTTAAVLLDGCLRLENRQQHGAVRREVAGFSR